MVLGKTKPGPIILLAIAGLIINALAGEFSSASELPIPAKVPYALVPFRPGAIKPEGWLRDWAKSAAAGITGHLDEWSPVFGMSWKPGVDIDTRGAEKDGMGWSLPIGAFWLDGLVRLAYVLDDPELIKKVQSRLDPVVEGALKETPSFIYWRPIEQLNNSSDSWANAQMGRVLVAYYHASGNKRILDALVRVYSNYPLTESSIGNDVFAVPVNLEPMLETYSMSGEPKIIKNALNYTKRSDFIEMINSYKNRELITGHVVHFYVNVKLPALVYPWTGNKEHLDATVNMLQKAESTYGLPVGLPSSEEHFAGIGSTRHVETCNVASGAWTNNWLLRITGERQYADRLEKIFFNAAPAPVSRDFETISYLSAPNRLTVGVLAEAAPFPPGGYESYQFSKVHLVGCCVGNVGRVIPNYIMHMWMKTPDKGVAATLYGPSRLSTKIADGVDVELLCQTDYPFKEDIRISITPSRVARFPLHLRIPEWCTNPEVKVNGDNVTATANKRGFVVISRNWQKGDVVRLRFPMKVSVVQGRETEFPNTRYFTRDISPERKNRSLAKLKGINNPYASVFYGPLLFALPVKDVHSKHLTPNYMDTGAIWNYALDVSPQEEEKIQVVRDETMPDHWHWQLDAPLKLRVPALQFNWEPNELQPLPAKPIMWGKQQIIELVPYGVTKYRISMFPVTSRSWKGNDPEN